MKFTIYDIIKCGKPTISYRVQAPCSSIFFLASAVVGVRHFCACSLVCTWLAVTCTYMYNEILKQDLCE